MSGMVCTRCFRETGAEPDFSGMFASPGGGLAVAELCKSWKCDDCLNEIDLEAIDRGEPPPSGAWGLVEQELNDCLADIQEGGSYEFHKERIDMLSGLLAQRDASGMSAFGQDPQGLEAKPASPTAESGDAQTTPASKAKT